ncbi:shikimate dehydrogenase [Cryobacterium frigoriphilum]|uniref:Shikimate dehydrogenase (NADP(+)) n=1 Tax=Cryobacterium frigoriphilum TaxID=1259150 RepID=A0A4R9A9Q7_9MICO|nr:shikimate dehydrogenase [Cryobacterium frigoriphilum]TFD54467.1 shikimate dehydrogenase [Cryobacterium frigoriphilum]
MSAIRKSFLVGLIGEGITHSLSSPLHEREAEHHGLSYVYRPVDLTAIRRPAEDVGDILHEGRDLGFDAFNITHPCKQLALPYLDEVSADARRLGAVNTVLIRENKFVGHNTDHSGFGSALAAGLPGADLASVVQIGAGGAGAAVAYALLKAGAMTLTLVDVDASRAADLATRLGQLFADRTVLAVPPTALATVVAAADGLVNATPIGMHSHPGCPIDVNLLRADLWVADVIYRPVRTELVVAAEAAGCRVLDGGHMAVGQAVDAFELITGIVPDAARMRRHFLELIARGE